MKSYYPKYMAEFLHEGTKIIRCKKCGAPLRNKESRELGIGKGCLKKMREKQHFKEEIPFVETGSKNYVQLLLFQGEK